MNYRLNSKLIKIKFILPVVIFLMAGNFFCPFNFVYAAENSNSFDDTIKILERWTSAHWGQDCFVWVVHYPEELTDAWAESEAIRSGMSQAEQEEFKRKFISDLRLDTSETFLISVYSFGNRPVNLSPVSEKISLLSSSGERIKPSKYDSTLDYPAAGVVQGLVFFPKQINKDYIIAINGMGRNERLFSFSAPETPTPKPKKQAEVVVVNLPKKQPKKKVEPVKAPEPPPPPQIPPRPITPLFTDTSEDMAEFVNSLKDSKAESKSKIESQEQEQNKNKKNSRPSNEGDSYSSRESVLRRFLAFWANNAPNEMYDMLSEGSQKIISRQNFAKEISGQKSAGIRSGLKGEYKIDWIGEERAKVTMTHKTLIFRSVVSRTLGVIREGSSWKIVW